MFYLAYTVVVHNNVLTSEYIKAIADGSTSYLNDKSMGSWFLFALFATGLPIAFSFSLYGSIMMHRALSNAPADKGFECETIAIWKYAVMMASNRLIISVFFCIALVICYDIRLYSYSLLVGSTMLTITYALDIIQHVAYVGLDCTVSLLSRVGIFVGWLVYWISITESGIEERAVFTITFCQSPCENPHVLDVAKRMETSSKRLGDRDPVYEPAHKDANPRK